MRVGVSVLTSAPGSRLGPEAYARQLVHALGTTGTLDYAVLVPPAAKDAPWGVPVVEIDDRPAEAQSTSRIPWLSLSKVRPHITGNRVQDLDVVHYPLTEAVPSVDAPTVVTLHEVQHRDPPDGLGPASRSSRRQAYDHAARAAAAVVAPSEFARERALGVLDLDPSRVHVVPLAVDHSVFRPGSEEPEPFVLYPSRAWPHANHARLFEAFASLRPNRPRLRLVLTGEGHERLGELPDAVESLGPVTPATLASLYRRAACLVFPRLYEGFGLPPLEAMACGCPVAAAEAGALPEACGDAAVYFDPTDAEAMAGAMLAADTRRDALRAKGFARAAQFTWDVVAGSHEAVYSAAASEASVGTPTTI